MPVPVLGLATSLPGDFQVPKPSTQHENGQVLTGNGPYGGADWGYTELGPGTPPSVRGSIYKKKILQDPGPNTHTAATIRQEVLTPPLGAPTPTTQKRVRGVGGYAGVRGPKSKISLWDYFWS